MSTLTDPTAASHADVAAARYLAETYHQLQAELSKVIVGQQRVVEELLIAIFARGHCLMQGVPGLAKTLLVSTLAGAMDLTFHRIQFTPDLMPSDITGTDILQEDPDSGRRKFEFQRGPIFANMLLADEINRTPPKTQSALLQAMQERQTTVGNRTFDLPTPFFVLATQNPIEQEGTYPLPEAQLDRFMLKLRVGYPSRDEEKEIMRRMAGGGAISVSAAATPQQILEARHRISELYVDERIVDYIVEIVHATRAPSDAGLAELAPLIEFGASPRATIALAQASRAHAFLRGRTFVTPDDVKAVAPDVLRHRVLTSFEADAEEVTSDDLVTRILARVEAP